MSLPRYREYKDSGVEWLGRIPSHWGIDRLKASVASARNGIWGDEPQGDENDIACVRVADFDRGRLQVQPKILTIRSVTEKERAGRLLNKGDLLLEKSGGGELQPVGQVVLYQLDAPAVCSNFVARVALKQGMCAGYWNYVHSAAYAVGLNIGAVNQTSGIQNLDQDRYFNERAPFPPESEQSAIAAFLDRETAKIDALIAEQEKLIALLAEKRQATISHAVTKGLDPRAPMKESGVAWLGEVPAHWEVARLKRYWSVTDCKHVTAEFVDDGFPLVSIREVQSKYVSLAAAKRTTQSFYEQLIEGGRQPLPGDLIFSRNATVGEVAQVSAGLPPFAMGQDVCLLRKLSGRSSSDFMQSVIRSSVVVEQLKNIMVGSTFKRVNVEEIRSLQVPVPPPGEQALVAKFIDEESKRLDPLEKEATRAIDLLRERRSGLIAAAVTGQIDVQPHSREIRPDTA